MRSLQREKDIMNCHTFVGPLTTIQTIKRHLSALKMSRHLTLKAANNLVNNLRKHRKSLQSCAFYRKVCDSAAGKVLASSREIFSILMQFLRRGQCQSRWRPKMVKNTNSKYHHLVRWSKIKKGDLARSTSTPTQAHLRKRPS